MTHTSGPWRFRQSVGRTYVVNAQGYVIADSGWWPADGGVKSDYPPSEQAADMRLIAAAPAMLAILRRIFATPGAGAYVCGEDQKRALAIIARIDGRAR